MAISLPTAVHTSAECIPLLNISIAFHPTATSALLYAWAKKYLRVPLSCFPLAQFSFAQAFCHCKGASFGIADLTA